MEKKELKDANWLMNKAEEYQDRYINAEKFILDILKMSWYKRIFILDKLIVNYIKKIK